MNIPLSQDEINIKFNIHRCLKLLIDDNDVGRISQILDLNTGFVKERLIFYRNNNLDTVNRIKDGFSEINSMDKNISRKILFIGDSITSERESYFNLIKLLFGDFNNIKFSDASVSGATTGYIINGFYLNVLEHQPDIVSIMIGTNDMRRNNDCYSKNMIGPIEYGENLKYFIRALESRNTVVIINTLPPFDNMKLCKAFPGRNWTYRKSDYAVYNNIIRNIANDFPSLVINDMEEIYAKNRIDDILMFDGVHLNRKGHELLTKQLVPILLKVIFAVEGFK